MVRPPRYAQTGVEELRLSIMASEKQIAANRRNAQKSTGPKSPEGKHKVSQNRTKHGFTAEHHVILPGEDESAYQSLRSTLMREWEPESEAEALQVELMAMHQWRMLRAARLERKAFLRAITDSPKSTGLPSDVEDFSRYEARSARAYYRALATLRSLQAAAAAAEAGASSASELSSPPSLSPEPAAAPAVVPSPGESPRPQPVNHLQPNESIGDSKPICPAGSAPPDHRGEPRLDPPRQQ